MRRQSKDSEDLQSERSSNTYFGNNAEDEYAKSFQSGPSKKFVNVTLPSISLFNLRYRSKKQIILQKTTLLHNMLSQLYNYLQAASLSTVCQRRLRRLLQINDQQVACM